jgi:TRAP-type uncharacterized transport system substrate-binding protein
MQKRSVLSAAMAAMFACAWLLPGAAQSPAPVPPSRLGEGPEETAAPEPAPPGARPTRQAQPQPRRQQTQRPARAAAQSSYDRQVEQANANTITLISGTVNGSYLQLANDFSFVLDDPDKLRILPVVGRGGYENIYDVLLLRGIDVGLIRSDSLDIVKREGRVSDVAQRLAYIAPLTNDEFHIVAPKSVASIDQLRGKRVNFDLPGSGTNISGRLIFEKLGIPVVASNVDSGAALAMLQKGELDAAVFMSLKPVRWIANIPASADLHLIDVPYDPRVEDVYYPITLARSDYPNLIPEGKPVSTISAKTILITYNWQPGSERYLRVERFVNAFFSKFDEFKKPNRMAKWQEVNLAATFPALPRFKPAADWLQRQTASAPQDDAAQRRQFQQFMDQRPTGSTGASAVDREKLFEEFTRWQRSRAQ